MVRIKLKATRLPKEGVYELEVNVPQDGLYMVFVESRSQGVGFRQLPHLSLQAGAG
ncbi:MAG TPA: hypothetical protein VN282_13935 [Pyrinomonadaceae bacterium]|nr:hypothetical protein [Pyrinomonadaceae bacterium]